MLYKKHEGAARGDAYAEKAVRAELICTNMLGRNAAERAEEWRLNCSRHPQVDPDRLIVHCSLSRPTGHPLSLEDWKRAVENFLAALGALGADFAATRHTETPNDHAHITYSRSLPDGRILSDSNDFWRGRAAAYEAARSLGLLVEVEAPHDARRAAATPTSDRMVNARRRAARRGTQDSSIDPAHVREALLSARSLDSFAADLHAHGIELKPAVKNGRTTGLLLRQLGSEEWLAGSSISREFSLQRVQAQIELNRQTILKRERELLVERQRAGIERQRQAQHVQHPRDRY
ncbi:relaxase/mobilization nuclease domain-containing protein [Rhodoferax sp.]|uniref:relaxase/mobilization nuclease domain-containing protein n=1 Tax=Rhodoferax sp. TaxID=50421 RepID=UPI0027511D99|nr:hypothetical protein [Rhodoferax sp.]